MADIHKIYKPFLKYFRKKRMALFEKMFNISNVKEILDVGGDKFNWQFLEAKPLITILNIQKPDGWSDDMQFHFELGDATRLNFNDNSFDLVFSNSVIEHLHTYANQKAMADEIKRVGNKYFVQTPAKEFFFEPHLLTPFIHWFPIKIQTKLLRNFTVWGIITRPTQQYIVSFLAERRLLTFKEFAKLFEGSEIIKERFLFITKSYIAIKR